MLLRKPSKTGRNVQITNLKNGALKQKQKRIWLEECRRGTWFHRVHAGVRPLCCYANFAAYKKSSVTSLDTYWIDWVTCAHLVDVFVTLLVNDQFAVHALVALKTREKHKARWWWVLIGQVGRGGGGWRDEEDQKHAEKRQEEHNGLHNCCYEHWLKHWPQEREREGGGKR